MISCYQKLWKILNKECIFSKVPGLQPLTLLKNELLHGHFSKILPTFHEHHFKEHLEMAAFGAITTQYTIICSKSTIETLEQGVNYVQI